MRDDYIKEALKAINDPNILINVVSRRVKQLKRGNRPLVESLEKLSPEDTALREVIAKFPAGSLQFEVGIQTFNEEVGGLIKRRQDYGRLADNFHFLRTATGVHIHADLIAGLPGETVESFAAGFDRLIRLGPLNWLALGFVFLVLLCPVFLPYGALVNAMFSRVATVRPVWRP